MNEAAGRSSVARGPVLDDGKELLGTSGLDAEPDSILKMPKDSIWPFVGTLTLTILFAALLLNAWWVAAGGLAATVLALAVWLWPERALAQVAEKRHG